MKTLELNRMESGRDVTVMCADGEVSVYRKCGYCAHCHGVRVGKRVMPMPQKAKASGIRRGTSTDDDLLSAQIMYNTLIRDGNAIICEDDKNEGYKSLYQI